ncbi:MAG: class I SAM-dependent RNA methyltransferase [Acidobacteria bacterium]|nr:class I SAM-dependent RNA methyltransferase [Acidobacteriota bacterium]
MALAEPGSLESFIRLEASQRRLKLPRDGAAVLAGLDYELEIEIKNEALRRFFRHHELPGRPERIIPSPRPRGYRTTSKRRCRHAAFGGRQGREIAHDAFFSAGEGAAMLEPEEHGRIFAFLEERLQDPAFAPLARALNFIIIRGTYEEFLVVFNLQAMNRGLHRLLLRAAAALRLQEAKVSSVFLIIDPSRSSYYLEADTPRGAFPIKRLFGPKGFRLKVGSVSFFVPPLAFSQVNESILLPLVEGARSLLALEKGVRLLDLYCGYGLFAFTLGRDYREVIAVDEAQASVRAGRDMTARTPGYQRIRFLAAAIERRSLETALPPPLRPGEEDVLLDPPRHGAGAVVIGSIARRRPGRVLHLFCAAEEMPPAIGHWRREGYFVRRVLPLDMFAGTPQLETMVLLTPA